MKRFRKINDQNGAAMVEFAIVLPLLLTLIFGMIEFSIMLYDKAMITNATREGTRWESFIAPGPIPATGIGSIPDTVDNYLQNNLISLGGGLNLDYFRIWDSARAAGYSVAVTVTYPYRFLVLPNFITTPGITP